MSSFDETFTVTSDNPLLHGHVVHGRRLLPGVGYVDLVLQVLARHGFAMPEVELRNLTILAPLVAAPGEEVRTTVAGKPAPAGGLRVEVRSRRAQDTTDVLHAVVSAHRRTPAVFEERLPLPLTDVDRVTRLTDIYTWLRERELHHSGLMRIGGTVHHRAADWVAEVELGTAYRDTADGFLFHPALFEGGLLGGSVGSHMLHEGESAEGLYLPLVFESFRAAAPLGTRCFVRVPADSMRRDDELIRLAVEFYDENGAKVAEIGRLAAKRVRSVTALDVRDEPAASAVGGPGPVPAHVPDPIDAPAAGRDVGTVLRELVGARLGTPSAQVDVHGSFYELGLASADLVSLVPELEDRLARQLSPTVMFEYRSIAEVAAGLGEPAPQERAAADRATAPRTPAARVTDDASAATLAVLTDEVAAQLNVPAGEVDPDAEFAEFGLDITGLGRLAARLTDRFGVPVPPAAFPAHRTVRTVADDLTAELAALHPHAGATSPHVPGPAAEARPHSLLHAQAPDVDGGGTGGGAAEGASYRTRFDGDEPFLRDHQVRGERILPAVAQLEMARAAVARTLGERRADGPVRLDDVVWLRPATAGPQGLELHVDVRELPGRGWEYSIHGPGTDGERTPYSQGRAGLPTDAARSIPPLAELRAACADRTVPAADVYALYAQVGMDYGPAQRSLVELRLGTDEIGRPQVLAELRLPAEAPPLDDCHLHPSVIDGALQATVGLRLAHGSRDGGPARPALPFAVEHVVAHAATPATAYAWIRHQPGSDPAAATTRLDVTVLDEHGRVCADVTGLSTRVLADAPGAAGREADRAADRDAHSRITPVVPAPAAAPAATDIAIIGLSGRYPEAPDLDTFWQNLRAGRDCIREVPADRWDHRRNVATDGSSAGKWGGFLDGIDRFDPLFFQISLHEAELLDPQERLFLQCAHHTLEDAGYAAGPAGKVGVFVGVMYQEYQLHGAQAQERGQQAALSGSASSVANRVSYFYDFTGPSMTVDTMCSSSLTAIHLACEAIKSGQCETALAGGVNLHSHPNKFLMLSQRRFLASDGRCRSFGEGGDGYVPGEGVGAVLLKPLERAIADGDHIHGVIKATALNHGGRTSGYSVPSPAAQGAVIAQALAGAGVDARSLGYLEAHGTGTALGDPLEVVGLNKAFEAHGVRPERCAIGSVKSNIGHCESAAGIAGLTKVLLQMRHGELVPSLHSDTLNPRIDFDSTPFRVQQHLEPWRRPAGAADGTPGALPRTAGVSGFGAGGSNAHLVVAEYVPSAPRPARPARATRPELLVLSAQSESQLVAQARQLWTRLGELADGAFPDVAWTLPDVAWTLQTGRMALEERLAFAASSLDEARAHLDAFVSSPGGTGEWVRDTVRPGHLPGAADELALRTAVSDWTDRAEPGELLRLWGRGATVDWASLRGPAPLPHRVGLPGYPFAQDRCWFDAEPAPAGRAQVGGSAPAGAGKGIDAPGEMVLLRSTWVEQAAATGEGRADAAFAERHLVVIGRLGNGERDTLRAALPAGTASHFVDLADGAPADTYAQTAEHVFTLLRTVLQAGVRQPALFQVALVGSAATDGAERERLACYGGLAGLLRTAHQENPRLHTQYVECLDGAAPETVAARLAAEAAYEPEPEVRHRDGRRLLARHAEIRSARAAATPWREDGVYLITGGAGGLGRIVAHEIAASVRHATVVLTGRSPLDEERRGALNALRAAGLTVDYQRADVADRDAVARVLAHVADNHGPLTGIVHSAGVLADGFLLRKSEEELARVLAPKVAGLVHLDELSSDQPLDVFLCFSSIAGAFGNAGQGDYAAGNAFMDAYATYRNALADAGARHGRAVSIGWPLWEEGGMGGGAVRENLRSVGLAPLDTARGLRALRCALAPGDNGLTEGRMTVLVGERDGVLGQLVGAEAAGGAEVAGDAEAAADVEAGAVVAPNAVGASHTFDTSGTLDTSNTLGASNTLTASDDDAVLEDKAVAHLRRVLAASLKLTPERISADAPLERYGMDSVIAVGVISGLEESFGRLSRTLLFEVETVRDLARYFITDHPQALRALVGVPERTAVPAPRTPVAAEAPVADAGPAAPVAPVVREDVRVTARDRATEPPAPATRDVAIIGISGRYPQADDLGALWANLRGGKDGVTEVPADRWDHEALFGDLADDRARPGKWGGFLDGVDRFDPLLFGISPREAAALDPQQRLFLETVWQLLEQSGVTQEVIERRYGRRVGVYVGAAYHLYRADESADPALAALTSAASYNMIANRVSHFFGLEGPSLAVDSMCASSAMAVHLACADVLRGETELAVAGGINLTVHPDKYVALAELQLLGSGPGSRSFRDGDGYLPAEAVGAVLLKPLDAALRDGDRVHAVIKGTASMHGGRANGFMTPSRRTQVKVMRRALEQAGVAADSIGYVEAAANGTAFSDEVEFGALREVFSEVTEPVALGTVKSNLGHPEAASGIAQLTKVVLQMRHRELTPLVAAGDPNPHLDFDGTALNLCEELTDWRPRAVADADTDPAPRRALINSVAAGGSHVSIVVEAPPVTQDAETDATAQAGPQLVVVSAGTPERLRTAARRLDAYLDGEGDGGAGHDGGDVPAARLADIAYTSQLGRETLPERLAVVAGSVAELRQGLRWFCADDAGARGDTPAPVPVHHGNAEEDAGPLGTVLSGVRGEAFLAGLVTDRALEHLAELWVRGTAVPWAELHDGRRRFVELPTTAFVPGQYWVGRRPGAPAPSGAASPASGHQDAADGHQTRAGTPAPRPARPADPGLTDAERTLVDVWSELLDIDASELGRTSNFLSLGGNSLLATRLINQLERRTGAQLPVQALFDAPRLADMAAELERRTPDGSAGALDVRAVLEGIALVEAMSDAELDALDIAK
ncbi:SDR family NAD(P)-dependent oxidoreductase [Streptomyces silaceus]|uniref:SDR family NAD(P)-dependent oxidoreductase n=1 Tax=Streptomyces silaceus TaxID=545123 RepID=UPI003CC5AF0B